MINIVKGENGMLTPKEISEKTFDKTFGFGYRMDDVDAYLDEAAKSMT